jgi:hypothetical protein
MAAVTPAACRHYPTCHPYPCALVEDLASVLYFDRAQARQLLDAAERAYGKYHRENEGVYMMMEDDPWYP